MKFPLCSENRLQMTAFDPGVFRLLPGECDKEEADYFLEKLKSAIPWTTKEWGRGRQLPRLIYQYDQRRDQPVKILDELILLCEEVYECDVHSVWCNYYRNGNDYTPFHQDSYGTSVFTYSFGCERSFATQDIVTGERSSYTLSHGDLYYFDQEFDRRHKHSIPKGQTLGERISIVLFTSIPYSRRQIKERDFTIVGGNMSTEDTMRFLSRIGVI